MKKIKKILIALYTKKLFRLKGRSGRREYCIAISFMVIFAWLYLFLLNIVNNIIYPIIPDSLIPKILVLIITSLALAAFLHFITVAIRRLHDVNFSGWWCIPIIFAPFGQLIFIALFFLKGTPGPNKYGEPLV